MSLDACPDSKPATPGEGPPIPVRVLFLIATLLLFFIAINMMSEALKQLTGPYFESLKEQGKENPILRLLEDNPVLGLLLGIMATSLVQSSSATTTLVVALVATSTISVRGAVPLVMGANIGTTVTNTVVAFAHARRKGEFEKALAAGTVHDWFNVLATLVLFPLEMATHIIENCAIVLKDALIGTSFGSFGGLKALIKPIYQGILSLIGQPWIGLALAMATLIVALMLMVKIMRSIFIQKMAKILDRFLFRNAFSAFVVGIIFTILVQSSSVTTSLVVPLVGAGILTLRQVFPYTLGANIGTTITAFLAALALAAGTGPNDPAGLGVTVAIAHLLFNVFGIVLIYPIRALPIWLAESLARFMTVSTKRAVMFLVAYFLAYLAPIAIFILF